MKLSGKEYWQDLETNKLFMICKTTGNTTEIGRDLNIKSTFNNELTGKASFKQRKQSNKESSMPKLPLYLQRQNGMLKKYESTSLNRSSLGPSTEKKPIMRGGGRYSVSDQLEELEDKEVRENRKRYISLQIHNGNEAEIKVRPASPEVTDEKDFFKLTRYRLERKNPSSSYNFTSNPENNDYLKPVPLHAHVTISKKLIEKKLLIEQLETKGGTDKHQQSSEEKYTSMFKRRQAQLADDPLIMKYRPVDRYKSGILRNTLILADKKQMLKLQANRKQKLLMERFFLKQEQQKEKRQFISLLRQKQG